VRGELFQATATGIRIKTKSIVDYNAIKMLIKKDLYFTFYTKADKPVKAFIRHFAWQ
jgi:hypothetical protein